MVTIWWYWKNAHIIWIWKFICSFVWKISNTYVGFIGNSYETYYQVNTFLVNTDWHNKVKVKVTWLYIFLRPGAFSKGIWHKLVLKEVTYVIHWRLYIEVRCHCLWVRCCYRRSYTLQVIFIEGHVNHKQVNQTPLKVRFSLFEGALLFIIGHLIFFHELD